VLPLDVHDLGVLGEERRDRLAVRLVVVADEPLLEGADRLLNLGWGRGTRRVCIGPGRRLRLMPTIRLTLRFGGDPRSRLARLALTLKTRKRSDQQQQGERSRNSQRGSRAHESMTLPWQAT
jgi:hypothetical protein